QNAHRPSSTTAARQPTPNADTAPLRTIRARSAPSSLDTWASMTLPTNSRFNPRTRYPRLSDSSRSPARARGLTTARASSVRPAFAAAMTAWSSRPVATQRAPRTSALPETAAGRSGYGRGEHSTVDDRERRHEPDRPARCERDPQRQHGDHGAVVAHQLGEPDHECAGG